MTMASNTFVHKHYEKVILAVLLLLFSGLLYLQLSVVQKSQGKKVDDIVNAPEPPADFVKTDYNAKEFSREALFDKNNLARVFYYIIFYPYPKQEAHNAGCSKLRTFQLVS